MTNKKNYIDLLKYYLRDLPENVIEDIIGDYEEHFRVGLENGKTEEEIAEELGNPELIAREFLNIEPGRKKLARDSEEGRQDNNNGWKIALVIALLIIFFPIIIGLIGGLIGIIFGTFGLIIGLFAAGIGIIISLIFGGASVFPFIPINISPLSKLLIAAFFIALALLIIMLLVKFVQWLIKAIKNLYISIKWRRERNHES